MPYVLMRRSKQFLSDYLRVKSIQYKSLHFTVGLCQIYIQPIYVGSSNVFRVLNAKN